MAVFGGMGNRLHLLIDDKLNDDTYKSDYATSVIIM